MRTTLLILIGLISFTSYCQNLSFDEVLNLRKKNIAEAEEYLSSKGWELLAASELQEDQLARVSFSYKKNSYSDEAVSFYIIFILQTIM